jgi:hypothetical protein
MLSVHVRASSYIRYKLELIVKDSAYVAHSVWHRLSRQIYEMVASVLRGELFLLGIIDR